MSKYKRTCKTCLLLGSPELAGWDNIRKCKSSNRNSKYAENNYSNFGNCKGGKDWVPLTVEIGMAEEEANKPWWQKLLTD